MPHNKDTDSVIMNKLFKMPLWFSTIFRDNIKNSSKTPENSTNMFKFRDNRRVDLQSFIGKIVCVQIRDHRESETINFRALAEKHPKIEVEPP